MDSDVPTAVLSEFRFSDDFLVVFRFRRFSDFFLLSKILVTVNNGTFQEAEEDSEDASDLDEELFNDPDTQEIIRNLVL